MSISNISSIELPYIKVSQKGMTFYLSKASAKDLKSVVDFHFREPYKEYDAYSRKDYESVKQDLENRGVAIDGDPEGGGIQRALNRKRVYEIRDYIENDPEALFPATVLLAIDTTTYEKESGCELEELGNTGVFLLKPEMGVSVIDGQHRLAGLFLSSDETLQQVEMPVIFMLNVSIPVAAKLFQYINGKQQKVNKSVIFDLFDNVPTESIDNDDDMETKNYHTICVNLYTDPDSPLYRQIKMLGVGGGAISQAFFIETCKRELKCLRGIDLQKRYDLLFDYFSLIQKLFPEDWPKPIGHYSDVEIDDYANNVLKKRKSQLAKTNGVTAMLRLFNWLRTNSIDEYAIKALCGKIDWTEAYGTGGAAQARLYELLKSIIVKQLHLE